MADFEILIPEINNVKEIILLSEDPDSIHLKLRSEYFSDIGYLFIEIVDNKVKVKFSEEY